MQNKSVIDQSLFAITWPIFVEFLVFYIVQFTDGIFLSSISDDASAGVLLLLPLMIVGMMFFTSISGAGSNVVAQYLGGNINAKVAPTYSVMLIINLLLGFIISAIYFFFSNELIALLDYNKGMHLHALEYLTITGPFAFIIALKFVYSAVLTSQGKTVYNMYTAIVLSVCNIALNALLVRGFWTIEPMGTTGIALATVIAQCVSLGVVIYIVHFKERIHFSFSGIKNQFWELFNPILRISLPSVWEPVSYNIVQIIVNRWVNQMGDVSSITKGYLGIVMHIGFMVGLAIALGTQIQTGHRVGAKLFNLAHRKVLDSHKIGLAFAILICTILYILNDQVMSIFTDNQEVWTMSKSILLLAFIFEFGRYTNLITGLSLKGSGDTIFGLVVCFTCLWVVNLPAIWYFGVHLGWGLFGVFVGMTIDEGVRAVLNYWRWNSRVWEKYGVNVSSKPDITDESKLVTEQL